MFDDDNDDLWSSLPKDNSYSDTSTTNVNKTSKTPYRGAISVPDFGKVQSTRQARRSPSPEKPKPAAEPVRYTSKVTAVINHAPSKNTESPDVDKKQSARITDAKPANRDRIVSRVGKAWPPPSTEPVTRSFAPAIRNSEPQRFSKPSTYSSTRTQQRSQSPPADSHYSKNPVQLRHSSPRQNVKYVYYVYVCCPFLDLMSWLEDLLLIKYRHLLFPELGILFAAAVNCRIMQVAM